MATDDYDRSVVHVLGGHTYREPYIDTTPRISKFCPEQPLGAVIDIVEGQVQVETSVQALGAFFPYTQR